MAKFKIGEIALVIGGENSPSKYDQICEILSDDFKCNYLYCADCFQGDKSVAYRIRVFGFPAPNGYWVAHEIRLKKIHPLKEKEKEYAFTRSD